VALLESLQSYICFINFALEISPQFLDHFLVSLVGIKHLLLGGIEENDKFLLIRLP